ncbi:MAG: tRNA pseudouridine synthase B [Legionellaceae bacterium]
MMKVKKTSEKQKINGILLLDKGIGISSNKALQQVKHLFNAEKAGHTGSLDNLATGMLPICFGEATKYSQYLLNADKTYFTIGHLGIKTRTGDAEGDIIAINKPKTYIYQDVQTIVNSFLGTITQIPPMHSALKHNGQPLYKLARKGIEIERSPRQITISKIEIIDYSKEQLALKVTCSKGTYIRTLIEDIGEKLGCGAHVTKLHRLSIGNFKPEEMLSLTQLISDEDDKEKLHSHLLSIDTLLPQFMKVNITDSEAIRLQQGQKIEFVSPTIPIVQIYTGNQFIGLGEIIDNLLIPKRLMAT